MDERDQRSDQQVEDDEFIHSIKGGKIDIDSMKEKIGQL